MEIKDRLFKLQDEEYRVFETKLIPSAPADTFIGVRTPELRRLAKDLVRQEETKDFLKALPHRYFDENQLHAFIISEIKDFDACVTETERFLPYIDNWATCDQLSPGVFKKHKAELLPYIKKWIKSKETYTVRFGLGMLLAHYLDGDFKPEYLDMAAGVKSGEYYINMMIAWYFATALAKQYDATVPYIEKHRLDTWVHNKTIQKATESRRIDGRQKEYLKSMRLKNTGNRD